MKFENNYPLISICVITYNHEKYIYKCLESLIEQSYPNLEIILCNDKSTDSTHKKILDFISTKDTSRIIKYFHNEKNKGITRNLEYCLNMASGDYIALCEGDDYWTSNKKLERQFELLNNSNFVGCFHDSKCLKNGNHFSFNSEISKLKLKNFDIISLKNFLEVKWMVPTSSIFFKRKYLELPNFYSSLKYGDFALFVSLLLKGDFIYLNELFSVYRMDNPTSAMNLIKPLDDIDLSLDYIYLLKNLRHGNNNLAIDSRIDSEIERIRFLVTSFKRGLFYKLYLKFLRIKKIFN